jgi:phage/plasmid-like protein (TIGR03299 family)
MSHLVETMAHVGAAPWHRLGNVLPPRQPLEVWADKAGMAWEILQAPVLYQPGTDESSDTRAFDGQRVLYRSDTKAPLSVVGGRYQVVQPRGVLEFYRDLSEVAGYELETAGVLKGGRKFWALARMGKEAVLKGNDVVKGYILLATSCDGTLATTATPTTVRVVCNNTLTMALDGASGAVRVPHSTAFDPALVKRQMGIAVSHFDGFMYRMKKLSERKVQAQEVSTFLQKVLNPLQSDAGNPPGNERALKRVLSLFEAQGQGAELSAAQGTAWGLLNSVTEYVDHERRARSQDYRLDSAWFGQGAAVKQRALDRAMQLIS